jgi:hypothetical protein
LVSCRSGSSKSATDSETSTTTGYACCCTVESPDTIKPQYHYEADYHVSLRRSAGTSNRLSSLFR